MDEGAAAITEDGGEGRPHGEDDTNQNYTQAKSTDGSEYLDIFAMMQL